MARPTNAEIVALQERLQRRALRLTRNRVDAADLVQDVMLKIVDKAPDLPLEEMIRWSLVVMRNLHLNNCFSAHSKVTKSTVVLDDQPELAIEGAQEAAVFVSETLRVLTMLGSRFEKSIETAVLGANDDDERNSITQRTTLHRARAALRERLNDPKTLAA